MMERIEDIFVRLLEKSPGIALITICILLVRYFLKKYPRKYSYFLWLALGIRLLWVTPIQLETPVFMELPRNYIVNQTASIRSDGIDKISVLQNVENTAGVESDFGTSKNLLTEESVVAPAVMPTTSVVYEHEPTILFAAAFIWVLGVAVFLLYFLVSYIKMKGKVRFAVKYKDNIYECDTVGTPFVMGILTPRIYLPCNMEDEHRKFVICHETCHIQRKDYLIKLVAFLLLGIYWFHPCVWVGYILMCRDMEMSCDEQAVGILGVSSKQAYSTALLAFAAERPLMGSILGFGEHNASKRIKNILAFRIQGKAVKMTAGILCGLLIPVLGCEVISAPAEQTREIAASPLAQELYEAATPYIGSVPEVGELLRILRESEIMPQEEGTLELQTDEPPYGLLIRFKSEPENQEELCEKMYNSGILLWALVENLENVEWTFPDKEDGEQIQVTYYLGENELHGAYGELGNLKEYGKSAEKVEELMRMIGIAPEQTPELKNPADSAADTSLNWTEGKEIIAIQKSSLIEKLPETKDEEHPRHEEKRKQTAANTPGIARDILALVNETPPMSAPPELDENSSHTPITLFYNDGTKDTFCFFYMEDMWYMKAPGNVIYEGGDFIQHYITEQYSDLFHADSDSKAKEPENKKSGIKLLELSDELMTIAKELDVLDERYYFAIYADMNKEYGLSREKACETAWETMMNDMKLYRYAVNHGMEIPEEELKKLSEKSKKDRESADNYEEMKTIYADAGLSFEEMDKKEDKDGLLTKIAGTRNWIFKMKEYEFRHGSHQIGAGECENINQYWSQFLFEEVYPEAENYDLSAYEKTLDEARNYYLEHTAK